jgi:hypothetical protein
MVGFIEHEQRGWLQFMQPAADGLRHPNLYGVVGCGVMGGDAPVDDA